MSAPADNRFWELRRKHGRDKLFESPEELWNEACKYFDWCDDNPWLKVEQLKKPYPEIDDQGEIKRWIATIEIPTARPYTIKALCLHVGIDEDTFNNYGQKEGYEAYFGIVTRIRDVIYAQKFEGAAVGAFNSNLIARDLGIVEKKSIDHTTAGKPIKADPNLSNLSDDELRTLAELQRKSGAGAA